MSNSLEILINPHYGNGATLEQYAPHAYELACLTLRLNDLALPLNIAPPPNYRLAITVQERNAVYYAVPGSVVQGMETTWSAAGQRVYSRRLWAPGGFKPEDVDGHPNLILEAPLDDLPDGLSKPPEGTWVGVGVGASALKGGLVSVIPASKHQDKPFNAVSYISRFLQTNR